MWGIMVGSGVIFHTLPLGISCGSCPVSNPPQGPLSGFGELWVPPNPNQHHWRTPVFQQEVHTVQPPILWRAGFAGDGVSLYNQEMMQRNTNIILFLFILFFPPFFVTLRFPQAVAAAASSPRQRHLSPGLFLPSLFGIAISSRTNPAPINNSSPHSLPLPPIAPSSFLLVCPFSCGEEMLEEPEVGAHLYPTPS